MQSKSQKAEISDASGAPGVSGHTPTPWRAKLSRNGRKMHISGNGWIQFARVWIVTAGSINPEGQANASLIIRAVNSHDALVKALEEMIEVYWGDGDGELPEPHCIQNARAALASAREVQP